MCCLMPASLILCWNIPMGDAKSRLLWTEVKLLLDLKVKREGSKYRLDADKDKL